MTETQAPPAQEPDSTGGPPPPALKRFIWDIQSMVELADSEREILLIGGDLTTRLLAGEDWLPAAFSAPPDGEAGQYQIFSDGMERFAVVVSILPAGSTLEIEQSGVWEIIGVRRGPLARRPAGGEARTLGQGSVETLRSASGAVRLGAGDGEAIAIHVYGGAIGGLARRRVAPDGASGEPLAYANGEDAPPYDIFSIQTRIVD